MFESNHRYEIRQYRVTKKICKFALGEKLIAHMVHRTLNYYGEKYIEKKPHFMLMECLGSGRSREKSGSSPDCKDR